MVSHMIFQCSLPLKNFLLLKREDEREKIEKNANQKHFPQKNSFILNYLFVSYFSSLFSFQ